MSASTFLLTVPRHFLRLSYLSANASKRDPMLLKYRGLYSAAQRRAFHDHTSRFLSSSQLKRYYSASSSPSTNQSSSSSSSSSNRPKKSMRDEIKEHAKLTSEGRASQYDNALLPIENALVFPRIKTTSISTKRIVITDEASSAPATLVVVAFRSFAGEQLAPWRQHFQDNFSELGLRWFDVTVNESFASQALSGFVQRWQRGYTAPELHDYYVAFNSQVRQPLEDLLLNHNRMFGNVLLLDRQARVRFRAAGPPSSSGVDTLIKCTQQLINEDTV